VEDYVFQEATSNDIPALVSVFISSIQTAAKQDYSSNEISEWLESANNKKRWSELVQQQTVIALYVSKVMAGFGSLKDKNYIDFLYVHGNHQKKGFAQKILDKLIQTAEKQGQTIVTSDVSYTARPLFEKNGFTVVQQNNNARGSEVLVNFKMELVLPNV